MSQRIAIVGYGVEGESAYRYIRSTWADAAVTIFVDAALPKEPPTGVDVAKRPKAIEAITKDTIVGAANNLVTGKRWAFGALGQSKKEDLVKLHEQIGGLFVS